MELTQSYIESHPNQEMSSEQYLAYREEKAREFMRVISKSLGKNMTSKELTNMEFGFKKGMDTATQGGRFIARGVTCI